MDFAKDVANQLTSWQRRILRGTTLMAQHAFWNKSERSNILKI